MKKKIYIKPEFTVFGNVESITKGAATPSKKVDLNVWQYNELPDDYYLSTANPHY